MIEYRKGSLFNPETENKLKVHACNAQGVWGSGIALEFKKRYPEAYKSYHGYCLANKDDNHSAAGSYWHAGENIGCLITSVDYGKNVDPPGQIIRHTITALREMMGGSNPPHIVHSNKFNSGLFNVPWEYTEGAIQALALSWGTKWIVWEP